MAKLNLLRLKLFIASFLVTWIGKVRVFVISKSAMAKLNLDLFGIILMAVAIWVGTWIGDALIGTMGFAGGILGAVVVGFIIYAIWALVSGVPLKLWEGLIFSVLIYISRWISGYLTNAIGMQGALIGTVFTAIVMMLLWGAIGGRKATKVKAPIKI